MIPRIIFRTVPTETTDKVEGYWRAACDLHPGWEHITLRDPISVEDCPQSVALRDECTSGAQFAGLVRLERLMMHGGFYLDSDFEPYRSLEPLVPVGFVAGWEDNHIVPDAVLGAAADHPALELLWKHATAAVPGDAWTSGPGATTAILPGRDDVLLLPPGSFYPYHWKRRELAHVNHRQLQPWCFGAHHWAASWL